MGLQASMSNSCYTASVNHVLWGPDGTLLGVAYSKHRVQLYSYNGGDGLRNHLEVTSPYGNNLHHKENITYGQFAFTTQKAGNYLACFWLDQQKQGSGEINVNLDWKTGIAAKDWESVARKEKIERTAAQDDELELLFAGLHV